MFWDYDNLPFYWSVPASHTGNTPSYSIGGKHGTWEGNIGDSWWDQNNYFCGCLDIPMSITQNADNYVIKFEVYVVNPWSNAAIRIWVTAPKPSDGKDDAGWSYDWKPYSVGTPYTTSGWKTISIPLSSIPYDITRQIRNPRLMFFTGGMGEAKNTLIFNDNFRIDNK
jgi:hypothetical protein